MVGTCHGMNMRGNHVHRGDDEGPARGSAEPSGLRHKRWDIPNMH